MPLYKKVIKKLLKKNITISAAESCTGGLLSSKFTSEAGISRNLLKNPFYYYFTR